MATGVALAVGGCRAASAICTPATLARDDLHERQPFQSQRRRLLEATELNTLAVHRRVAALIEQQR
jgi:hypothetical protein